MCFFLRADVRNVAKVKTNEKVVNKGKGKGTELPCTIIFTGTKQTLSKLKKVLKKVIFNKKDINFLTL